MRIGRHIGKTGGILNIPAFAHDIDCQIFQIFSGSSYVGANPKKNEEQLKEFGQELEKYNIVMVIHGIYVVNLAAPIHTPLHHSSVTAVIKDLTSASMIGKNCLGVVYHVGKNPDKYHQSNEIAMKNYITSIEEALAGSPPDSILIIETGSSSGNEIGSKIEGLAHIYDSLNKIQKNRVKFCIDTCHIWATGYDISSPSGVKDYFTQFNKLIGINKIACIHFNNSQDLCGSHKDHHSNLITGTIPEIGLATIARIANKYDIPVIFETPGGEKPYDFSSERKLVEKWINKK